MNVNHFKKTVIRILDDQGYVCSKWPYIQFSDEHMFLLHDCTIIIGVWLATEFSWCSRCILELCIFRIWNNKGKYYFAEYNKFLASAYIG
jgi:hypothetical protein